MMTEKQAWLELAAIFLSDEPLPTHQPVPFVGICSQLFTLVNRGAITAYRKGRMIRRLDEHFNPNGVNPKTHFFWLSTAERSIRDLRATACGFLAAMCDD